MKRLFFSGLLLLSLITHAQKITNFILVGSDNKVTGDVDKAVSFIVVKQYPDEHFERLDYKKGGPMSQLRSYKDPDLRILQGRYFKYATNGMMVQMGQYENNQKTGKWITFNDSGKIMNRVIYDRDSLVETLAETDSGISYPDEKEASFPGGIKAWQKYLEKALTKAQTADKAFTGGQVHISFRIDTEGNVQDIFVNKSVEYIIDEESIKIIQNSPKWIPAFQNGRNVNAYRKQPITFSIQE